MGKKVEIDDIDIDELINSIDVEETNEEKILSDTGRGNNVSTVVLDDLTIVEDKKPNETGIDLEEKYSLANKIVENSLDVIKKADKVFVNFSDDVIKGKDRSTSSKEILTRALEIQNAANKNLIDLSRSLNNDSKGGTNILIDASVSHDKSGVNPNNIKSHFNK